MLTLLPRSFSVSLTVLHRKLAAADANTKELLTENERMAATMEAIKQQNSVSGHTHSTIAEGNRRTSYPSDAGFPHVENITYSEMNADQAAISVVRLFIVVIVLQVTTAKLQSMSCSFPVL